MGEYVQEVTTGQYWVSLVAKTAPDVDVDEMIKHEKGLFKDVMFTLVRRSANSEIEIGRFYLSPMPGCCGIVVVHGMWLNEKTRGQALSDPIRKLKTDLCKALGYSQMIATTRMDQIPAVGNFFKSKYNIVKTFTNRRTDNLLAIGLKDI